MKTKFAMLVLTSLLILTSQSAFSQATIDVQFIEPGKFTDAYPRARRGSERELNESLEALKKMIVTSGNKLLKAGDELKMEVLDVNLAGDFPPTQRLSNEVRIMREIDWPSMKFRYTLKRGGKETKGEATISDMAYLQVGPLCSGEALCYERRMVEKWFRKELQ